MKTQALTQQTDYRIIQVPYKPSLEAGSLATSTFGGAETFTYLPLSPGVNLFRAASSQIQAAKNSSVRSLATEVIQALHGSFLTALIFQGSMNLFPPLQANVRVDGSILIEWIFDAYRLGFSIENPVEESNWYLLTNKQLGDITASGTLLDSGFDMLLPWLLHFISSNF